MRRVFVNYYCERICQFYSKHAPTVWPHLHTCSFHDKFVKSHIAGSTRRIKTIKPVKHSAFEGIICDWDPHNAPSISRLYYSFIANEYLSVFRVNTRRPSSGIYIAFSEIMRCLQQTNYSPAAPKRNKWSLTAVKNISGFDDNFRFGEKPTAVFACLFKNMSVLL